jgi:hypothetical protein
MKRQMLIFSIVAALVCSIIFATAQTSYSQNATKNGNACMSCGPIAGTNLTNTTKGGNVTNDNLSNPLEKKVADKILKAIYHQLSILFLI